MLQTVLEILWALIMAVCVVGTAFVLLYLIYAGAAAFVAFV